jgi:hypothetical protein
LFVDVALDIVGCHVNGRSDEGVTRLDRPQKAFSMVLSSFGSLTRRFDGGVSHWCHQDYYMNYYTGIYWRYRPILEYGQGLTVLAVLEVACLSAQ